jgi:hypothetical protein
LGAKQLRINPGPRKDIYTRHYGKFRVDVYFLPLHRIVVYEMEGYINADQSILYIDDLLVVAESRERIGMIADPRKMKVLSPECQTSIQDRFWPAIAGLGIKKNPGIVPPSALTQSSVKRMVATMGETITLARAGDADRVAREPRGLHRVDRTRLTRSGRPRCVSARGARSRTSSHLPGSALGAAGGVTAPEGHVKAVPVR